MKKTIWKKGLKTTLALLLTATLLLPLSAKASGPEGEPVVFSESEEESPGPENAVPETSFIAVPETSFIIEETASSDASSPQEPEPSAEEPAAPSEETGPETQVPAAEVRQEEAAAYETGLPRISYTTHVQSYGWMDWSDNGEESGTWGQSKRLEALMIRLDPASSLSGSVEYRTHIQTYGWMDWVKDGAESGTTNQGKRMEAAQIRLTGAMAEQYDIYYRVHCQSFGWTGWAKNGAPAGSMGYSKRLEAIQIVLTPKGAPAPGDTGNPYYENLKVTYQTHVQTYGWQQESSNGQPNGTTGKSKRLEGIKIRLENHSMAEGSVEYCTHVQTYGWQDWVRDGAVSGTTGKSKRLEAIRIRLTGAMAEQYDIYYRVHCQTFGWTGWAKNGAPAGSEGYSKRLESIEICLTSKNGNAPGSVNRTYFKKSDRVTVTRYGKANGRQLMCYTLEDQNGNLAIIDGGYESDASILREVIQKHGNRVSAWIITHPHPDHAGAFNAIMSAPGTIQIDQIYTVPVNDQRYRETAKYYDEFEVYEKFRNLTKDLTNVHYVSENEEFDLLGLRFKVLHAWDDTTDRLNVDLCNNGSMVFILAGKQEKMLFLSDLETESEAYVLERHRDELDADYVQAAHHGNWGVSLDFYAALSPQKVFMDAPDWLLRENAGYDAHILKKYFEQKGIPVSAFSTAPNEIPIH